MKECPPEELILRLAQNELDESQSRLLVGHAERCEKCGRLLEEYKTTFRLLATEKTKAPSSAEWERVMASVRQTVAGKNRPWPLWAKGAVAAVATACLLLILWQVHVGTIRRPGGFHEVAQRSEDVAPSQQRDAKDETTGFPEKSEGGEELQSRDAGAIHEEEPLEGLDAPFSDETPLASETRSLDLANLDDGQLNELDELFTGSSVLHRSDLLIFDLSEEEEEELVRELESLPST